MKFLVIAALFAAVECRHPHNFQNIEVDGQPPSVGLGHKTIPWNREDYDNSESLWKSDWAKYRAAHPND